MVQDKREEGIEKTTAEGHDLKYLVPIFKIYYFSDDLFQSSLLSWPIM